MNILIYIAAAAGGVSIFAYLYLFNFDHYTEKALIRLSFHWVSLLLFGLLGLAGSRSRGISNPLVFAAVGTLLGITALALFLVLFFLS